MEPSRGSNKTLSFSLGTTIAVTFATAVPSNGFWFQGLGNFVLVVQSNGIKNTKILSLYYL